MAQVFISGSASELVTEVFRELDTPVTALNSDSEFLTALAYEDIDNSIIDRIVASESALKTVRDDFAAASHLQEYVDEGTDVGVQSFNPQTPLFVGDDAYIAVFHTPDGAVGHVSSDLQTSIVGMADQPAEEFPFRTAAYRSLRDTASETFGDVFVDELDAVFAHAAETGRGGDSNLVGLLVLLAARGEQLLYDLNKWGEDIGIASKATFSRMKTDLEEEGLIDTESEPTDIGRPRLRLIPGTDEIRDANTGDLFDILDSHGV